jgi:hypothetical protein
MSLRRSLAKQEDSNSWAQEDTISWSFSETPTRIAVYTALFRLLYYLIDLRTEAALCSSWNSIGHTSFHHWL